MLRAASLVLLVAGAAGCGRAPRAKAARTLRVHVEAEPPTLNPLVEHDAWTSWLALGAIYDPLVREDARGAIAPCLSMHWRWKDARTLRMELRPGVRWHDGRPFTADDVVATFARLREPGASGDLRADFAELASVERE